MTSYDRKAMRAIAANRLTGSRLALLAIAFYLCALPCAFAEDTAAPDGRSQPRRVVEAGGDWAYAPFEYIDEAGYPAGFNVDVMRAIGDAVGIGFDIRLSSWAEARERIERGDIDLLMGMYKSPERAEAVDFSSPHFYNVYGLFARKGSSVESLDDLVGHRVAVQDGDRGHDYAVESGLGSNLVALRDWRDVFGAILRGEADYAIASALQGSIAVKQPEFRSIEMVGPPLFSAEYCVAVRKGDEELLALIDEGLARIRSSGEYDTIYMRWFGHDLGPGGNPRLGIVAAVATAALTVIAAALIWALSLRRLLTERTAELSAEQRRSREAGSKLQAALAEADEAARKAESAAEGRSAFIAWISQELRTPLQGILGAIDLLGRTRLDASQSKSLAMARSSSEQLNAVLTNILDAMGAERRTLRIEPAEFRYLEFASWLESELRPRAEDQGLGFRFSARGQDRLVNADRRRISQVIMNLCANAIGYTDRGEVELSMALGDEALYVSVKDTGPGLTEEARKHLFQPFYDASRIRKGAGIGLGLAQVKAIVDAMDGSIRYETSPSIGTRFEVSLPIQSVADDGATEGEAGRESVTAEAPALTSGGRVIVAEDEAINRLYLKRLLETSGYTVSPAGNGLDALEAAGSGSWDFILMDVSMPRMDGLEATRRIRAMEADRGLTRTPIIALTAHAYAEDRQACVAAGMDGFLSKPFAEPALWDEVRRVSATVALNRPGQG
ncbi:MAG TPA: transporter substrate-binding domain-containing protein [Spirochaetales bacterium]|nr:transporter substrate-binding domain-containing protein [Spirochaetales bacterium]